MAFLVRRLLQGVVVLFGISTLVFALTWLTGDPASVLLPISTPPDQVEAFRHRLGLDQPLPVQYVAFLSRAIRGDFIGLALAVRHSLPSSEMALLRFAIAPPAGTASR